MSHESANKGDTEVKLGAVQGSPGHLIIHRAMGCAFLFPHLIFPFDVLVYQIQFPNLLIYLLTRKRRLGHCHVQLRFSSPQQPLSMGG